MLGWLELVLINIVVAIVNACWICCWLLAWTLVLHTAGLESARFRSCDLELGLLSMLFWPFVFWT